MQKKKLLCILLTCVMLLSVCPGAGAASDGSDIIFLALNDAMPYSLSAGTMPFWSGGTLFVHSSTFDITSLNLSGSYNAANMTLLIYSGTTRRSLTFYLSDGYVQTQSGTTEEISVILRGDQVFVPLEYCAGFFGIGVSYLTSLQGWPLVRLTTGAQVWEDGYFIERADKLINERAGKYTGSSIDPQPPQIDPPTVVEPPVSDPDDPEEIIPNPPEDPTVPPEVPVSAAPIVYPALVGIAAAEEALPLLTEAGLHLTVYLDAEEIRQNADFVRQLYTAGQMIGLCGDPQAANDALDLALCRRSLLLLDAEAEGYFCHFSTQSMETMDQLSEEPALLRLEGRDAADTLSALIEDDVVLLPLLETTVLFRQPPVNLELPETDDSKLVESAGN